MLTTVKKLFASLNGLGKVLVGVGAAMGVVMLGAYSVVTFSGDSVSVRGAGVITDKKDDSFRWDSGKLLLSKDQTTQGVYCTAEPDAGEERRLSVHVLSPRTNADEAVVEPWFDGSATVTCSGPGSKLKRINIHTGRMAELKVLSESRLAQGAGLVLVAGPIGLAFVLGRRKEDARGE